MEKRCRQELTNRNCETPKMQAGVHLREMVPRGGIEPPTLRFSVACSTN
jgi:hypothetical protein